jgi:aspartyl-tRNA(Asn)/glutamyl-tRNA(Gln) amidotransferase subunit A
VPDYLVDIDRGIRGARIAVSPDFTQNAEVDEDIAHAFNAVLDVLRKLGATVETVPFPHAERFDALFRLIAGPEFSEVHRKLFTQDPDAFDFEVRERVEWSLTISTDDYVRALRERELLIREVMEFMKGFDAMLSPSIPIAAPPIDTRLANLNGKKVPYKNRHRPFLSPHNLTGFPAMSLPMGFNRQGLPVSIQVVSKPWREADMLRVAQAYEAATPEIREKRPAMG